MSCEFCRGYLARASWGWPRWANPWPLLLWPHAHALWDQGWVDAYQDARPAPVRRLEPEVEECCRG